VVVAAAAAAAAAAAVAVAVAVVAVVVVAVVEVAEAVALVVPQPWSRLLLSPATMRYLPGEKRKKRRKEQPVGLQNVFSKWIILLVFFL